LQQLLRVPTIYFFENELVLMIRTDI